MYSHACWLNNSINTQNARRAIKQAVKELKEKGVEFDTVAFSGMSGALFAPVLAHKMSKEMILVRKPQRDEMRHSSHDQEGYSDAERVLIVDDICSSGKTVERIMEGVKEFAPRAKFVGAYFYANGAGCSDSPKGFVKDIVVGCLHFKVASEEETCVTP